MKNQSRHQEQNLREENQVSARRLHKKTLLWIRLHRDAGRAVFNRGLLMMMMRA